MEQSSTAEQFESPLRHQQPSKHLDNNYINYTVEGGGGSKFQRDEATLPYSLHISHSRVAKGWQGGGECPPTHPPKCTLTLYEEGTKIIKLHLKRGKGEGYNIHNCYNTVLE